MMFSFSQNVLSVKFVSAAFTMMLLSACTLKTEAPIINVDASDDIVIYGSLPADQALDLKMTARFESTNKSCGNFVDISHAYPLSEMLNIEVKRTADQYRAHFFRDALSRGECDWSLIYVSAELTDKSASKDWRNFYNATPEDLAAKYLESIMPKDENHLLEVNCKAAPKSSVISNGSSEVSIQKDLKCDGKGMYLVPKIHSYHVNYQYFEN